MTVPEVRRLLEIALPLPARSVALRLAWSEWRRTTRFRVRHSHYRRHAGRATAHHNADTS